MLKPYYSFLFLLIIYYGHILTGHTRSFGNNIDSYVNVVDLGVVPNSPNDQAIVLQQILDDYENIYIPQGEYVLSKITIPSNRRIVTDGYRTKFVQSVGMKNYDYMVRIQGTKNIHI